MDKTNDICLPPFLLESIANIIYYQNEALITAISENYSLKRQEMLEEFLLNPSQIITQMNIKPSEKNE